MDKPLGKKELRRLARLERKSQETERLQRARRRRLGLFGAIGAAVLAAAVWGVWSAVGPEDGATTAGVAGQSRPRVVEYPDQGRAHISPGQPHPAYNSNPPTSGWHFPAPADWGFYNEELPDELLVHNLEHGGIWISFKDAGDTELIDRLVALSRRYRTKVVITLRAKNDSRLALVAWGRLMTLDQYDERAIVDFINRFKNKGPEFVPD